MWFLARVRISIDVILQSYRFSLYNFPAVSCWNRFVVHKQSQKHMWPQAVPRRQHRNNNSKKKQNRNRLATQQSTIKPTCGRQTFRELIFEDKINSQVAWDYAQTSITGGWGCAAARREAGVWSSVNVRHIADRSGRPSPSSRQYAARLLCHPPSVCCVAVLGATMTSELRINSCSASRVHRRASIAAIYTPRTCDSTKSRPYWTPRRITTSCLLPTVFQHCSDFNVDSWSKMHFWFYRCYSIMRSLTMTTWRTRKLRW